MKSSQVETKDNATIYSPPLILANLNIYNESGEITEGHVYIDDNGRYHQISYGDAIKLIDKGVAIHDLSHKAAIMPGFYETHIHGYGGHDYSSPMDFDAALAAMRQSMHALGKTGVTAVMPTTVTLSIQNLKERISVIDKYVEEELKNPTPGLPTVTGIHLEGPFISCKCKGAHDEKVLHEIEKQGISLALFQEIIAAAPHINDWKITIDPALPGMIDFLEKIAGGISRPDGTVVNVYPFIGHTNPDPSILQRAMETGVVRGFTHLGNAMAETAHHKNPQDPHQLKLSIAERVKSHVVQLALDTAGNFNRQPLFSELIVDGAHLSKAFVEYVAKTVGMDRVVLISDALGFTGLEDGPYTLGTVNVVKQGEQFWIADKNNITKASTTLAGSAASYAKIVMQYYQWLNGGYEAVLQAAVLNPRQSTSSSLSINYNDSENFVILNDEGELLMNGCNGVIYSHPEFRLLAAKEKSKALQADSQNKLALAFIEEVTENQKVKEILLALALNTNEKIYVPLIDALKKANGRVSGLDSSFGKAMQYLCYEHAKEGQQKTAIFRDKSFEEIINSDELPMQLLLQLQKNLFSIESANTVEQVFSFTKAMTDAGYCYVECYLPFYKSDKFQERAGSIKPSVEELESRSPAPKKRLAVKMGVGTHFMDFIPMADKEHPATEMAWQAGKSVFTNVSRKTFIKRVITGFDKSYSGSRLERYYFDMSHAEKKHGKSSIEYENAVAEKDAELNRLKTSNPEFYSLIMKMELNKIPFDKKMRVGETSKETIAHYAKPSSIEKLSMNYNPYDPALLISSASGTMARILIAMLDINAYGIEDLDTSRKDLESIDMHKVRIFCNLLISVLIYGGHHSFIELAESANRLFDQMAIELQKTLEHSFKEQGMPNEEAENKVGKIITRFINNNQIRIITANFDDCINAIDETVRASVEDKYNRLIDSQSAKPRKGL